MNALLERDPESVRDGLSDARSQRRRLEFDTTLHFLDRHLPPQPTVLHLGAGNGALALHFARKGSRVLAIDLDQSKLDGIQETAEREGLRSLQVKRADAVRLDSLSHWDFQAVLCLGPYHHFRTREVRRRCLLECRRVAHDRGVVAVSYVNRNFALAGLLARGLDLTPDQYNALLEADCRRADFPDPWLNSMYLTTPEAVEAEVRSCGFEVVEHLGTDGMMECFAEGLGTLDSDAYPNFLEFHLKTCTQPSGRGASHHGLVLLKKV